MSTLFTLLPELPEGFQYFPDFLSPSEEQELADLVSTYPLKNMIFQGFEAKRKVMSFGYDYKFDRRELAESAPIPGAFAPLIEKVAAKLAIPAADFKKLLLTEYSTGTVINWHRDAPPFDKIAGISLLSDCTFRLRPYDKTKRTRASLRSFTVERRSLYLMQGEAREAWEHSIAPVHALRYSITMRTLRKPV